MLRTRKNLNLKTLDMRMTKDLILFEDGGRGVKYVTKHIIYELLLVLCRKDPFHYIYILI